jgi:hypothetical protein
MWKRHLLVLAVGIGGLAAVAASLLSQDRLTQPKQVPEASSSSGWSEVVAQIDQQFRAGWEKAHLRPAPRASALTIARRLSLGLTGTVPSLEEIRALENQPEQRQVDWWVSHLLEDRRYADYVAERLARALVGTEQGPFIVYRRRRFVSWLSERLAKNDPYDVIARDLISGTGLWTDSPAVNFVTVTADDSDAKQPDPISLAARTTRAFLGIRIDCLQCHDDHLGNIELGTPDQPRFGEQRDFHRLAAYFSDARLSLTGVTDTPHDYQYQFLDSDHQEIITPAVPFLPEAFDPSGNERQQLAHWVTDQENRPFGRAIVNRVWALMFGRPLVEPIDNIPLFGPFPPGLEALVDDFVTHQYDLQRLIRVIAATEVFQRDSRADFPITPEHESRWAAFPLSRLRPEQVAGGLIQACSLTTINADSHIFAKLARFFQQNDFIKRYGDMGDDEFQARGGTVTQRLIMMNGKLVEERTAENLVSNASTQISKLAPNDQKAVEVAYLAVLTRRPSTSEARHFQSRMANTSGKQRDQCLEDLFWVLLNSTEFSWNH